jgi:HAD superfamily hydrolase (TIGR01509 family)
VLTRRPRAVLLDAGNTLLCLDFPAIAAVLGRNGVPLTAAALARAEYHGRVAVNSTVRADLSSTDKSRAYTYFAAILEGAGLGAADIPALFAAIRAVNDAEGLWRVVPEGTREMLASLRADGVTVGVISNADGRVEAQLAAAGLSGHLDFVIDSHRVGVEKPDPRIFRMGLERAGVEAAAAVYVGDLYAIDVAGARAVGMPGVLVDPLLLESVDCPRVRTVAELPGLFPV